MKYLRAKVSPTHEPGFIYFSTPWNFQLRFSAEDSTRVKTSCCGAAFLFRRPPSKNGIERLHFLSCFFCENITAMEADIYVHLPARESKSLAIDHWVPLMAPSLGPLAAIVAASELAEEVVHVESNLFAFGEEARKLVSWFSR